MIQKLSIVNWLRSKLLKLFNSLYKIYWRKVELFIIMRTLHHLLQSHHLDHTYLLSHRTLLGLQVYKDFQNLLAFLALDHLQGTVQVHSQANLVVLGMMDISH
jgi:hypothetical protein